MIFVASGAGFFSLCGQCAMYFSDYSLIDLHSSVECLGPCTKHFCHWSNNFSGSLHDFLDLISTALPGVVWQVGFSSLTFPTMNSTVRFCPRGGFRRRSSFVGFLRNLRVLKYLSCLFVGSPPKVPALYIGLLCQAVRNDVEDDLVQFFGGHLLGGY